MAATTLPAGVHVFERGWLSANNILLIGSESCALVDSGYCTHARQTLDLIDSVLVGRRLDVLVNSHLHSDHCGGNAALQTRYPDLRTLIPPGQANHVRAWDEVALTYTPTGQSCPRFKFDAVVSPGDALMLGDQTWHVHAASGHDPHSIILFEPQTRTLISADALWQSGFGVVFPELDGVDAFSDVLSTLDLIESLDPSVVIPGHGPVFSEVDQALKTARRRLEGFTEHPAKHARYGMKVLLKFKLLERKRFAVRDLIAWASEASYFEILRKRWDPSTSMEQWILQSAEDLVAAGAAEWNAGILEDR